MNDEGRIPVHPSTKIALAMIRILEHEGAHCELPKEKRMEYTKLQDKFVAGALDSTRIEVDRGKLEEVLKDRTHDVFDCPFDGDIEACDRLQGSECTHDEMLACWLACLAWREER